MIIKNFTEPDLDYFRDKCNFVGIERDLFELRSKGVPLEDIADKFGYTPRGLDRISKKVNNKIKRVLELRQF